MTRYPVDDVKRFIGALGLPGNPGIELCMQAGVGKAIEQGLECLAAREHQVAVELA